MTGYYELRNEEVTTLTREVGAIGFLVWAHLKAAGLILPTGEVSCSARCIARELRLSPTTASEALKRLGDRGYIVYPVKDKKPAQ